MHLARAALTWERSPWSVSISQSHALLHEAVRKDCFLGAVSPQLHGCQMGSLLSKVLLPQLNPFPKFDFYFFPLCIFGSPARSPSPVSAFVSFVLPVMPTWTRCQPEHGRATRQRGSARVLPSACSCWSARVLGQPEDSQSYSHVNKKLSLLYRLA